MMLNLHVVIANRLLSDFICRVKLAGHSPEVLFSREFDAGESHVVIGIARINEVAARTLVLWLRSGSGARSVALNWEASPRPPNCHFDPADENPAQVSG